MWNLMIQAVFERGAVAVWEDGREAVCLEWQSNRDELQMLLPKIEEGLEKAGAGWGDIGKIVIVTGVGNFSATRISVTIANMLGLASGAKLYELKLDGEVPARHLLEMVEQGIRKNMLPGGKAKKWSEVKLARPVYRHAPTITPSKSPLTAASPGKPGDALKKRK